MAAAAPATDPILMKFRKALDEAYGSRIERIVLFGSRARGDASAYSDYDIAIFLRDLTDRRAEVERLTALQDEVMADADPYIDAIPFPAGAWAERSSFMHQLRREGLDL
jgi:predicted nucleotidyltransferase